MIVVLVILAILAAMMVPALLGWIDEARNRQYVLEARSVYMAVQAIADERYAAKDDALTLQKFEDETERIKKLADVTLDAGWLKGLAVVDSSDDHQKFTIKSLYIVFTSKADTSKTVYAVLNDDSWSVTYEDPDFDVSELEGDPIS